ncbi:hypothetical protein JCM9279_004658 [Rhodotorula babjevae]
MPAPRLTLDTSSSPLPIGNSDTLHTRDHDIQLRRAQPGQHAAAQLRRPPTPQDPPPLLSSSPDSLVPLAASPTSSTAPLRPSGTSSVTRSSSLKSRSARTMPMPSTSSTAGPSSSSATPHNAAHHAPHLARRAASPVSSISLSTANGGGGGGFIGGGFAGSSSSAASGSGGASPTARVRRGSFGSSSSAAAREARRCRARPLRLVVLVVGAVAVWWVVARWKGEVKPRHRLSYRWWEADQLPSEDLAALLPKPTLPPRPPRPKPPPVRSHSLTQILKLPSTVSLSSSSPHAPDWTAIVHLTSSSQLVASHLSPVVDALAHQSPLAPARILLLIPQGMAPAPSVVSALGAHVSAAPYRASVPPVVALADAARDLVSTGYVLFVDGHVRATDVLGRERGYVKALLHASGTKEYGSALLTAGGVALPQSHHHAAGALGPGSAAQCVFPVRTSGTAQRLAAPSLPFLAPTSWLLPRDPSRASSTSVLQGLATDLPLELALAAALWTKHAIPTFALPLSSPDAPASPALDGYACDRLQRSLAASPGVASLFEPAHGGGQGLRILQAAGDRSKGGAQARREWTLAERAEEQRARLLGTGTVVVLVSGRDELDAVRGLACRFAGMAASGSAAAAAAAGDNGEDDERGQDSSDRVRRDFKVFVADYDPARERDEPPPAAGSSSCHLDLTPIGALPSRSSSTSSSSSSASTEPDEPVSLALVDALDALDPPPAFVLFLSDGLRAREFDEVLRWMGGFFGVRGGGGTASGGAGGERLSRARAEREMLKGVGGGSASEDEGKAGVPKGRGRPTIVGMTRGEAKRAEWIGALDLEALRHFHTPRIDLSVVTNDRPVSLHRLLSSLQTAHYFGDDVSLSVNLEQTADRLTHRLVDDLRWPHGTFSLRHRILLGGLMPAIVESWYPTSNDTYGVLLEDDVEVSPLYYAWLKFSILQYRYTLAGRRASARMFGVSLYQQKNIELRPEGRQEFDPHKLFEGLSLHATTPYLSQIPCSWGAAYFPEHWREFHSYLALRLSELALPISEPLVPAIRSNKWPRSWKKYFIELVYLRGYTMLYPNYPDFESLSTNHLEKGTHVKTSRVDEKKKALFEVPLLDRDASLVDSLPGGPGHERLPAWDALPTLDLWGALASEHELLERGWQTTRMLGSCGRRLPSLEPEDLAHPRYDARELLCERVWDRETEGRLVDAQPLAARGQVPPPAQAQAQAQGAAPPVVPRARAPAQELEERAAAARRDEPAVRRRGAHQQALVGEEVRALEVDGADAGSRGGLFPAADKPAPAHGDEHADAAVAAAADEQQQPDDDRGRRRRVDLAARRAHAEEAELELDGTELVQDTVDEAEQGGRARV